MILEISVSEIKARQETFVANLKNRQCDAALLFSVTDIFYLTGFNFRPSERPIALIVDAQGAFSLFVPRMEVGKCLVKSMLSEKSASVKEGRGMPSSSLLCD